MFVPYEVANIRYTNKQDETTERVVLPTFVPPASMKAIDVTDLSDEERGELQGLLKEYAAYYAAAMSRVFSFDDWIAHTTGLSEHARPAVKWRTFVLENTEIIE